MEENIERISNLIKYIENADYIDASQCFDGEDIQAIKNLLTRYKQLEEENKKLIAQKTAINNKRKELEEEIEGFRTGKYISLKVNELYIPKSKVKEKIEELSNEEDIKYTWTKTNRIIFKEDIIDILQELLREE